MAIELIGIDLDGTLYHQGETPSDESVRVLRDCARSGIHVCICTGRSLVQISGALAHGDELDELCVLTNGASIVNWKTNAYVLERRIDPDAVDPLLRALVEDCLSVPGRHLSATGMYTTHVYRSCASQAMLDRLNGKMHSYIQLYETLDEFIRASKPDIQRIDYSVPFTDGERVLKMLSPIVALDSTTGDPRRLELVPKGINKGDGLSRLAAHYGIKRECVMAVGDGINDDSMIQWAGLGVAMGNAVESLKKVADVVTDTSANDGLAKAIERYALGR